MFGLLIKILLKNGSKISHSGEKIFELLAIPCLALTEVDDLLLVSLHTKVFYYQLKVISKTQYPRKMALIWLLDGIRLIRYYISANTLGRQVAIF